MSVKDEIITKFYDEHGKTNTIAAELGVRPSYVTKVIQKDVRYNAEKEARARLQKEKRKKYKKDWIANKRISDKELDDIMKIQHIQASKELSYTPCISNVSLRKSCSSAYNYNSKKKNFKLDTKHTYSIDMPKVIKY